MYPSRSLQPLLESTIPRLGSVLLIRHPRHFLSCRYYGPYRINSQYLERDELLRRLEFPRASPSTLSKVAWTAQRIPRPLLLYPYHLVQYLRWRKRNPRPPDDKHVAVKSRIGRHFYDFLANQKDYRDLLNSAIKHWGYIGLGSGPSMLPTLGPNPTFSYSSYSYASEQDIDLGHVVHAVHPKYDEKNSCIAKE